MTTTERDWTRDDPYAGQELPAPPAWLPDAGEAVRAPVGETVAAGGATAAASPPTGASSPAPPAPDLTKRQPETPASEAPAPPAEAPAEAPADPPADPPAEPPAEPPGEETNSDAEADSWDYVPLGIPNAEAAAPPAEPHYVNPEIIEPPLTVAEPPDAVPGLPGQHWFDEGPKERPWHLIAMAGSLVLLIIVIAVIFVAGGDGGKGDSTAQTPPASALPPQAMPTEAVAARPVPAEELDALRPQAVAVGVFDGQLQVTWDPPRSPGTVSGYFVIAQTPGTGEVEQRHLVERDSDLTVVLDDTDVCVVVTTVVSSPQGLQLARGELVCPPAPTSGPPTR